MDAFAAAGATLESPRPHAMSLMMRMLTPVPWRSQVWAPSFHPSPHTSRHRTQRVVAQERSVRSVDGELGYRYGKRMLVIQRFWARVCQFTAPFDTQTAQK